MPKSNLSCSYLFQWEGLLSRTMSRPKFFASSVNLLFRYLVQTHFCIFFSFIQSTSSSQPWTFLLQNYTNQAQLTPFGSPEQSNSQICSSDKAPDFYFFLDINHKYSHQFNGLRLILFELGRVPYRSKLSQRCSFYSHEFRTWDLMIKGCKPFHLHQHPLVQFA